MPLPLVSVVIAAHNAERYIEETLQSVCMQTFANFEIIVVDDGSTDRTAAIAAQFNRARVLQQPNRGSAAARNAGILAANGAYVAFLDADDIWLPEKLERQVSLLIAGDLPWIYSDAFVFYGDRNRPAFRVSERMRLHDGDILSPLLLNSFIASPTPVVKRQVLLDVGLLDESRQVVAGEDWDLWLRIAERYPVSLIPEPLALIRSHDDSLSGATSPAEAHDRKRIVLERAFERNPAIPAALRARARARIAVAAGLRHARLGQPASARRMFAEAIRHNPAKVMAYSYLAGACLPAASLRALAAFVRRRRAARPIEAAV